MNVGKREIFHNITETSRNVLEKSLHCERLFTTDQAGTGRTFLFNLIKNHVNRCHDKQVVKVGALAGVTARLVGGTTLHSLLKLHIQKNSENILDMPVPSGKYFRMIRQEQKISSCSSHMRSHRYYTKCFA